jgi:hypothetical protein
MFRLWGVTSFLVLQGCSSSNDLFFGRVEAMVGAHDVVVTDCYRTSVPPPQKLQDTSEGQSAYRFTPCKDADVFIRGDELTVNGKSYGHLNPNASILVDHGVVSVK